MIQAGKDSVGDEPENPSLAKEQEDPQQPDIIPQPPPQDQNQAQQTSQDQDKDQNNSSGTTRTPGKGDPDTTVKVPGTKPGETTERTYGPDGRAVKDIDSGHPHDPKPHAHDWDWSKKPPRQPRRDLTPEEQANLKKVAAGVGVLGTAGLIIHTLIVTAPEWGPWAAGALLF